jgi:NTE family protein
MTSPPRRSLTALVMTGGGARAAYQVGVLKAVCELMPRNAGNPFPILCGTSAGALNAAALAVYAQQFRTGVRRLNRVWANFHVGHVFRAGPLSITRSGGRWLLAMMMGRFAGSASAYMLDREPLAALLQRHLPFEQIQKAIDSGDLHAVSISASGYSSGESVNFFQGADSLKSWRRARRMGIRSTIELNHLMASSAIPFLFRAVPIHREFFGDGSMRQQAPISPALHLGAERILVIGVHKDPDGEPARVEEHSYPSPAQIAAHVFSSIFLDSLDTDLERLDRINTTLRAIPDTQRQELGIRLREVETLVVSPSEDLGEIAERHAHHLPRMLRFFLRGIGATSKGGAGLVSYLLFEKSYCQELISLGYADAMQQKTALTDFLLSCVQEK